MRKRIPVLIWIALAALTLSVSLAAVPAHQGRSSAKKKAAPRKAAPAPKKSNSPTAISVPAELVSGHLNPEDNRTGNSVSLRLNGDIKSNGVVILPKGATVVGVVRHVTVRQSRDNASIQSLVDIEWLVGMLETRPSYRVKIAVQSVRQTHPPSAAAEDKTISDSVVDPFPVSPSEAPAEAAATEGLNVALLSMPTVVAADPKTASVLQTLLGSSGNLFHTGRGLVAGKPAQSLDIFSHLQNDTVITSRDKGFDIGQGATFALLVGVRKI